MPHRELFTFLLGAGAFEDEGGLPGEGGQQHSVLVVGSSSRTRDSGLSPSEAAAARR